MKHQIYEMLDQNECSDVKTGEAVPYLTAEVYNTGKRLSVGASKATLEQLVGSVLICLLGLALGVFVIFGVKTAQAFDVMMSSDKVIAHYLKAESCASGKAEYVPVFDDSVGYSHVFPIGPSVKRFVPYKLTSIFTGKRSSNAIFLHLYRFKIWDIGQVVYDFKLKSHIGNPAWASAFIGQNYICENAGAIASVLGRTLRNEVLPLTVSLQSSSEIDQNPSAFTVDNRIGTGFGRICTGLSGFRRNSPVFGLLGSEQNDALSFLGRLLYLRQLFFIGLGLPLDGSQGLNGITNTDRSDSDQESGKYHISAKPPIGSGWRHGSRFADDYGFPCICGGWGMAFILILRGWLLQHRGSPRVGWSLVGLGVCFDLLATTSGCIGCLPWDWSRCLHDDQERSQRQDFHNRNIVPRKTLTGNNNWGTVIDMANVLSAEKQTAIIAALAEGSSIRSIERITGVHRDTIMRLGVKVGQGCTALLDEKMRNLPCRRLEMDEIWGFVGKKDRNVHVGDEAVGSVWTFCAIDAETKLVPAFKVGDRSVATAKAFVQDVADRMAYRVQISTDGLNAYVAGASQLPRRCGRLLCWADCRAWLESASKATPTGNSAWELLGVIGTKLTGKWRQ